MASAGRVLSQCCRSGVLKWDDSPLVTAAVEGYTVVVDEADKAPQEVICILKVACFCLLTKTCLELTLQIRCARWVPFWLIAVGSCS